MNIGADDAVGLGEPAGMMIGAVSVDSGQRTRLEDLLEVEGADKGPEDQAGR